jgi:hypothetical protein
MFLIDLPVSESPEWGQWDEGERILQQEGVFTKSSFIFTELVVGLHSLCFQIDPCPENTEDYGKDGGEVQV